MVKKMELNILQLKTAGDLNGVKMDTLDFLEMKMMMKGFVELECLQAILKKINITLLNDY